ncbi:ATPase AAA [Shewanella colwelliana]|uniref:AAA family ATPase n=1 Tax=Shewanella colwelliana TaxID=23 RepID=UPI001BC4C72D|nr:AAA family ATPase [Shewanella colwelliana]GIU21971.1 ATPase AAA [Shewanella colwelliana]
MTFQTSVLLPSQEALLHRLQHVALYGQQLTVLVGDDGAGKTTLVTALVDELEHVSSALVTCPMHADSNEIRRKILVQLLSEPVFDDEIPLPETLLQFADVLPHACHIVLDDAHLMPLALWAECMVLSQIVVSGKQINLTLTTNQAFLSQLLAQLPESQHELVLPMNVEALPEKEREALYYTLLSRSEQTPFTPRDIVRQQLQLQSGLPVEVVNLLYLALNDTPQAKAVNRWRLPIAIGLGILVALAIVYALLEEDEFVTPGRENTVAEIQASRENYAYGEELLHRYFAERQNAYTAALAGNKNQDSASVTDSIEPIESDIDVATKVAKSANITTIEESAPEPVTQTDVQADAVEVFAATEPVPIIQAEVEVISKAGNTIDLSQQSHEPIGYTLQLASVKQLKSLNQVLAQIDAPKLVKVARYKRRWVVLYGEFASVELARQQAKQLVNTKGIAQPWLRAWADLSQYELQQSLPTREIH